MKNLLKLSIIIFLVSMMYSCTKDELPQPESKKPVYESPKIIEGDTTNHSGFGDM